MGDQPVSQQGVSIDTLRKKFFGQTDNERTGLDDAFFARLKLACEMNPEFREVIKAILDTYDAEEEASTPITVRTPQGKTAIIGPNGEVIGIQG